MVPGFYPGIPGPVYHANEAVSASRLKLLRESGRHCKAAMDGKLKPTSDALIFGHRFHAVTLEPDLFQKTYIPVPEGMKLNLKEGKDWKAAQTKEAIPWSDWKDMLGMAEALNEHPIAGPYLRAKGRNELSAWSKHERTGLDLRCRFDRLLDCHLAIDLKSTVCARPWKWIRDAAKLGYHIQSAFYQDMLARLGEKCEGFIFLAVEKTIPYNVLCCELDAASINKGRSEYERLLDLYKQYKDANYWPGYSDECEILTLPDWSLREEAFESATPYLLN